MEPDKQKISSNLTNIQVIIKDFSNQQQLNWIVKACRAQLSQPYSLYTYNYFLTTWPQLTVMAYHQNKIIGCIIGSLDTINIRKAYIAMLVVSPQYRRAKVGKKLFDAFYSKVQHKVDKIVLQTECVNIAATKFYLKLGFFKTRCMKNYYMSGTDAFRLKLYIRQTENKNQKKESQNKNQITKDQASSKEIKSPSKKKKKGQQVQRRSGLNIKLDDKQKEKMAQALLENNQTKTQEQNQKQQ